MGSESSESQSGSTIPQHTPGPWEWREAPWGEAEWWLVSAATTEDMPLDTRPILDADPSGGEYNPAIEVPSPDATLITAAPDLLAELRRIVDYWARPSLRLTEWEAEEMPKAMVLVARAEGRDAG